VTGTSVSIPTRTLLLGLIHQDGTLLADEIQPMAEACSLSPEQVRSCLRRLVADGLLTRERSGRQARFRATLRGLSQLRARRERFRSAYRRDRGGEPWDGCWHLVAFAVPEARRADRRMLRQLLRELGGAPLQGGVYLSPHPWEPRVREEAKRLGLEPAVHLIASRELEVAGVREAALIARRLWPVEELERSYRAFLEAYAEVMPFLESLHQRAEPLPDAAFLPGALEMAVVFGESFERDPLLPLELLPHPWPGTLARELLLRSRRLALRIRRAQGRPPLFHTFDETLEEFA